MESPGHTKKDLQANGVLFVYLQFVDLNGLLYSATIPAEQFDAVVESGVGIDGYSCGFVEVEKSDLVIKPDVATMRILPWETSTGKVAICLCDIYEADGETRCPMDPRYVLQKAIGKLKSQMGEDVEFLVAPEPQFWVLTDEDGKLKLWDEGRYYSPPPIDKSAEFRQEIAVALAKAGIPTEKSHHETTPGKYEVNVGHGLALDVADMMQQFKFIVKNLAARKGLIVSFMPKPFNDRAGNGMHFHQNLARGGKNIFGDEASKYFGLSDLARSFIAGQLKHSRALVAITNPSVNSYRRFHQLKGTEAPSYILWAQYNRTSLMRVPPCSPRAARFEFRGADGSMNPYLGFAAFLMSGLDGIKNKLTPPEPVEENVHTLSPKARAEKQIGELPWNLSEALDELQKDEVLQDALAGAYRQYLKLKRKEWTEYGRIVTDWELERYLDV